MWLEAGQVEVRSGSDGRPLLLRCEHVGTDPVRRGTGAVEGEWICFGFQQVPSGGGQAPAS